MAEPSSSDPVGPDPATPKGEPVPGVRRRTFGPVLLLGLAAGALAAVAGTRDWVSSSAVATSEGDSAAFGSSLALTSTGEMPLAAALSLVLLACWGVLLVTRGRVRRAVAGLAVVAAVGLLVATVVGLLTLPGQFAEAVEEAALVVDTVAVERTAWGWAALVGAVLSLPLTLVAVRDAPDWPEMGSRYDAPAGTPAGPSEQAAATPSPDDNLGLWKAIDEGRDPTA